MCIGCLINKRVSPGWEGGVVFQKGQGDEWLGQVFTMCDK